MKKAIIPLIIILALLLAGCTGSAAMTTAGSQSADQAAAAASESTTDTSAVASEAPAENAKTHEEAGDTVYDAAAAVAITLNGDSIDTRSDGVTVNGGSAAITQPGTYLLSGSLTDGQIIVNSSSKEVVRLVLNGVDIHSSSSAPIYVADAGKVVILLAEGTKNILTDGTAYAFAVPEEEEPSAAVFSKADLTIAGAGSLTINANFRDGISSKDGLLIAGGSITVSAIDDGLRGKDYLVVEDGQLTVTAGGDGLKSDNDEEADKGYISVSAGALQVTSGGDAINAQTDIIISGGTFALTSGGGSANRASEETSAKGIKGSVSVNIDGGTFTINSADDAIHSNGAVLVNGGMFEIASADDGIHADQTLTINDGEIRITQSYEGLESAVITINNGSTHIASSDDGVNVAGGVDASGIGGPGQNASTYGGDNYLYINGGYLYTDARGDGIDVNGAIEMTDGTVVVNGPTENMNAALDYDGGFKITGGLLVAAGSSGMAQSPDQNSTQSSVLIFLTGMQSAGTVVNIQNQAGESILTFAPSKSYQSIAFSSPALVQGETYTYSVGGQAAGAATDGLYLEGSYTPAGQTESFTLSGAATTVGTGGQMGPGGGRPGGGGPGGPPPRP